MPFGSTDHGTLAATIQRRFRFNTIGWVCITLVGNFLAPMLLANNSTVATDSTSAAPSSTSEGDGNSANSSKVAGDRKPQPTKTVVYKEVGEVTLKLHLFLPEGWKPSDRRGAIVFFFGGGWVSGSPEQFYPQSSHLAERGMVAVCAEYRIKKTHMTTPWECVADGHDAVRWVRQHAAELGVDPDRLAAGGGSAGGHVAAAVALCPDPEVLVMPFEKGNQQEVEGSGAKEKVSSTPNGLVLFNPVYDNGPTGWGHKVVQERWESISPLHNIRRGMPPAIVFLGTNDKLIPVATAKLFQTKMEEVDVRSELHLYEGAEHGFFNPSKSGGEYFRQTLDEMTRFLDSLGYFENKRPSQNAK